MSSRPKSGSRILFVYDRVLANFMARDWEILSREWPQSKAFCWQGWHDVPRLGHEAARSDLILCWFGAAHALASVLVTAGRQPVVVVAGGWDVARLPDIDYGAHTSWWRHHASRFLFTRARRVLAVSEFTRGEAIRHAQVDPEKITTVYHGFDPAEWPAADGPRPLDVVTVSGTHSLVKGIDLVIDTAVRMPDVQFEILGPRPGNELESHMSSLPANLTFLGRLSVEDYRTKLQSARVCFQPSRQESFCCAVAEAMLSGCVPVVSDRGALREVLGEEGVLVGQMLPQEFERGLRRAFAFGDDARARARNRIVSQFHIDGFAERLLQSVREAL